MMGMAAFLVAEVEGSVDHRLGFDEFHDGVHQHEEDHQGADNAAGPELGF